jgi:hypothetical protein
MKDFYYKFCNWVTYGRWTGCQHDWMPLAWDDWHGVRCGAER